MFLQENIDYFVFAFHKQIVALTIQAAELKKKADEEGELVAQLEELKKKQTKDIESLQRQVEELQAVNDKLDKSKKKIQAELEDSNIDLEAQRAKVLELEKKQRNFDKVLSEEKVSFGNSMLLLKSIV